MKSNNLYNKNVLINKAWFLNSYLVSTEDQTDDNAELF